MMKRMVKSLGECILVTTPWGSWQVPRHYIALHGVKASELGAIAKKYGFKPVDRREFGYELINMPPGIRCSKCGKVSSNLADVRNLYCPYCKKFHEQPYEVPK